jgi:Metal-dependent amidase/aminoacylase/carboxypeptidase
MNSELIKKYIKVWIDENKQEFYEIADYIWENPELGLEEYKACEKLTGVLAKHGFTIQKDLAGMPTAFIAVYGGKGPVLGMNAEYDCLPGLSQEANCSVTTPVVAGAPGQGCGHNLLGTTAVLGAVALR